MSDEADYCEVCGEAFPCSHDNPPLAAVDRDNHDGWAHGYWSVEDA